MKKQKFDSLTIQYITGLERENRLQSCLIKEQEHMIELLEKENASLREHIEEFLKLK